MRDDPLIALIIICAPLSLLAIGGSASIYAPLQHQVVNVQQWFTGREYLELFAIARVAPGPGSMLTTLIGLPGLWVHWSRPSRSICRARCCASRSPTPGSVIAAPAGIPRSRTAC